MNFDEFENELIEDGYNNYFINSLVNTKNKYCIDKKKIESIIIEEINIIGCKCNMLDCPYCHEIRILKNIKNKLL